MKTAELVKKCQERMKSIRDKNYFTLRFGKTKKEIMKKDKWDKLNKELDDALDAGFGSEEPKQENCCTPEGQIKRYVDCKGCDRKPKQEMKQTAVEWLEKICNDRGYHLMSEYFEQAKAMEKEQIIKAVIFGDERGIISTYLTAEQYYNETFKSE